MQPNRVHRDRLPNVDPCPIALWDGDPRGKPGHPIAPFAICADHARKLYETFDSYVGRVEGSQLVRASIALDWLQDERRKTAAWAEKDKQAIVYYVQIGEHIKIGHTINLQHRLHSYPPYRRLLATELGGQTVEHRRHREYKHLLAAGREWFTPAPDLLAHINDLRRANGAEPIVDAA